MEKQAIFEKLNRSSEALIDMDCNSNRKDGGRDLNPDIFLA